MKTLALALLALAAAPPEAATDVTLRRSLAADATDVYSVESTVKQTVVSPVGTKPSEMHSKASLEIHVGKADPTTGKSDYQATTTYDKLEATGSAGGLATAGTPKPVVQRGKIDDRGRVTADPMPPSVELSNLLAGGQGAVQAGLFVEFPEKAIKVGDGWDVIVPKGPLMYGADQRLRATLTGEKVVDGKPAWTVSVAGTLKVAVDSSQVPGLKTDPANGGSTVRLTGENVINGEGLVDKATGRTLSMNSTGTFRMKIELVELGLTIDSNGSTATVLALKTPGT